MGFVEEEKKKSLNRVWASAVITVQDLIRQELRNQCAVYNI
jgi:hypothetical protein